MFPFPAGGDLRLRLKIVFKVHTSMILHFEGAFWWLKVQIAPNLHFQRRGICVCLFVRRS